MRRPGAEREKRESSLGIRLEWQRACVDDATAVGSAAVGAIFDAPPGAERGKLDG